MLVGGSFVAEVVGRFDDFLGMILDSRPFLFEGPRFAFIVS